MKLFKDIKLLVLLLNQFYVVAPLLSDSNVVNKAFNYIKRGDPYGTCNCGFDGNSISDRVDCGYNGITREQCEQRGCCYDDKYTYTYYCFYPILFHAATTSQGASVLVRKIIPIAIGSILFQRTDIDENDFVNLDRKGIPYQLLKRKSKNRIVVQISKWIKGILDALDKKYLKDVYMMFCNIKDETDVKESYKFSIAYLNCDSLSPEEIVAAKNETLTTTDYLLKSINDLKFFTKFKLDEVTPNFALSYYNDVTPMNYLPPHYGGVDERNAAIINKALEIESSVLYLGVLKTISCRVKCRGKGPLLMPKRSASEYTSASELNEESCVLLSDENSTRNINGIQCSCIIAMKFNNIELIECSGCLEMQHAPCRGYLYHSAFPKNYHCDKCKLMFPSPQTRLDRQNQSIYQLAVAYAFFNNVFPTDVLNYATRETKEFVIKKLLDLECIKPSGSGYTIEMQQLETKVIDKLFEQVVQNPVLPDSNFLVDHHNVTVSDNDSLILDNPIKKLKIK
ncbi:hypothetical protein FQR65_LT02116 [Abscondita terminalis]|nr:hypothetical protein FQR65_LT02116 [Abscondita terminalis]